MAGLVPGHQRRAVSGESEDFRQLDDVDNRDALGQDDAAVGISFGVSPGRQVRLKLTMV
jgi:hypothetical protein